MSATNFWCSLVCVLLVACSSSQPALDHHAVDVDAFCPYAVQSCNIQYDFNADITDQQAQIRRCDLVYGDQRYSLACTQTFRTDSCADAKNAASDPSCAPSCDPNAAQPACNSDGTKSECKATGVGPQARQISYYLLTLCSAACGGSGEPGKPWTCD